MTDQQPPEPTGDEFPERSSTPPPPFSPPAHQPPPAPPAPPAPGSAPPPPPSSFAPFEGGAAAPPPAPPAPPAPGGPSVPPPGGFGGPPPPPQPGGFGGPPPPPQPGGFGAPSPASWGAPPPVGGPVPPAQPWTNAPAPDNNGMAVAAMVTGIISLVTFWLCGLGALLGLVAVVLGIVALSKANKTPARTGRGQAIAGIATGGVAVVITLAFLALIVFGSGDTEFREINSDPPDGFCDSDRFMEDPDC